MPTVHILSTVVTGIYICSRKPMILRSTPSPSSSHGVDTETVCKNFT